MAIIFETLYLITPMRKGKNTVIHTDSISLNKYISDTGFCSRRDADDYIQQARVSINKELAEAGNRVKEGDVVEIDGEPLKKKGKTVYLLLHKPSGVTSTTDEKDKTNIISFVNYKQRIFPVGRLDKESEGAILLTNDGNIVNKMLRAGNLHEKEYLVTVDKPLTPEFLKTMSEGVRILRTKTKPCKVNQEGKYQFRITLVQGLNRQIRRMCDALDYKVKRLVRLRIMNLKLGKLVSGSWRYLTPEEIATMQQMMSDSSRTEEASAKQYIPKRKTGGTGNKPEMESRVYTSSGLEQGVKNKKNGRFKDFRQKGKK